MRILTFVEQLKRSADYSTVYQLKAIKMHLSRSLLSGRSRVWSANTKRTIESCFRSSQTRVCSFGTTVAGEAPPKTAVVMLNMGGPNDLDETGPFLSNLFNDGEIIQLGPLQNYLGPWIAHRRTPSKATV